MAAEPSDHSSFVPAVLNYRPRANSQVALSDRMVSFFGAVVSMSAMVAVLFAVEMAILLAMDAFAWDGANPPQPVFAGAALAAILLCWLAVKISRAEQRMLAARTTVEAQDAAEDQPAGPGNARSETPVQEEHDANAIARGSSGND